MQLTVAQIDTFYERINSGQIYLADRQARIMAEQILPEVRRRVIKQDANTGEVYFVKGGTLALKEATDVMTTFVLKMENEPEAIDHVDIDTLLWICHNNGVFADAWIDVGPRDDGSESRALDVLNKWGYKR